MGRVRRHLSAHDLILRSRVGAEDDELEGPRTLLDRVLVPLNRAATGRFLREARRKVWHNTREVPAARLAGPQVYAARLAELEALASAGVQEPARARSGRADARGGRVRSGAFADKVVAR